MRASLWVFEGHYGVDWKEGQPDWSASAATDSLKTGLGGTCRQTPLGTKYVPINRPSFQQRRSSGCR